MALYLYLAQQLVVHAVLVQLTEGHLLERDDEVSVLLTSQVHVTVPAIAQLTTDVEVRQRQWTAQSREGGGKGRRGRGRGWGGAGGGGRGEGCLVVSVVGVAGRCVRRCVVLGSGGVWLCGRCVEVRQWRRVHVVVRHSVRVLWGGLWGRLLLVLLASSMGAGCGGLSVHGRGCDSRMVGWSERAGGGVV